MDTTTRPNEPLRPGIALEGIRGPATPAGTRTIAPRHGARRLRPFWLVAVLLVLGVVVAGIAAAAVTAAIATRPDYPGGTGDAGSVIARSGGQPTAADGYIADGDSLALSDMSAPAVARLDPALREALDSAHAAAAEDGLDLRVGGGWRSKAYQAWLLRDAVRTYGSAEQAARWVGTPETSQHVKGEAVDISPYAAADWLNRHGAQFGLCRTYDNEAWHFELSASAVDAGCPPMYRDPTEDPRMRG